METVISEKEYKMRNTIDIDYDYVVKWFYMEGSTLHRHEDNSPVTTKKIWIEKRRYLTKRVIFVLLNDRQPGCCVVLDDSGIPIEISERLNMVLAYSGSSKINETTWSKSGHRDSYTARWTPLVGNRLDRAFNTSEEAKKYQLLMMEQYWGPTLRELNLTSYLQ